MALNIYRTVDDIPSSKKLIDSSDNFFVLNAPNKIDNNIKKIMMDIDKSKWLGDGLIRTPYGVTSITNLSTGCKTVINCYTHPELAFNGIECGYNALGFIIKHLRSGNLLTELAPAYEFDDCKIDVNYYSGKHHKHYDSFNTLIDEWRL